MTRLALRALVAFCVLMFAAPAWAAADPLEAVPDSAAVVVRLRKPRPAIERALQLIKDADNTAGRQLQLMALGIGSLIGNPNGAGIDANKDWYLAVFMSEQARPSIVYIIPATDKQRMRAALGERFQSDLEYDDWVLYSTDSEALQKCRLQTLGRGRSIAQALGANSKAMMDGHDLSLYLNLGAFKQAYRIELDAAKAELEETLANLGEKAPIVEGADMDAVYQMYGDLFKTVLQGFEDAQGLTIALSANRSGLSTASLLSVTPNSPTDKLLQLHQPSGFALLEKLPADRLVYAGVRINFEPMVQWSQRLVAALAQTGDPTTAEDFQTLQQAMQEFSGLKYGEMAMSFGLGSLADGVIRYVTVAQVTPTEKVRELTRQVWESRPLAEADQVQIEFKPDAETYGTFTADVTTQKVDPAADPLGIWTTMYGAEGMVTRTAYLPDAVVQTIGGGTQEMQATIDALTGAGGTATNTESRARSPQFQTTRRRLPAEANAILLIDVPGLIGRGVELAAAGGLQLPVDAAGLKPLGEKRSYSGFALSIEPGGIRTQAEVPSQQIIGLVKIGQMLQQFQP
ncbi:MAG: hypothetical protein ACREIV_05605, partial [Planctomycetaceae bacterium]